MTSTRLAFIDCSKYPSEGNCKVKMSAPETQIEQLIDIAVYHACETHGQKSGQELKTEIRKMVEYKEDRS